MNVKPQCPQKPTYNNFHCHVEISWKSVVKKFQKSAPPIFQSCDETLLVLFFWDTL